MPAKKDAPIAAAAHQIITACSEGANVKQPAAELLSAEAKQVQKTQLPAEVFGFLLNATKGFATAEDAKELLK